MFFSPLLVNAMVCFSDIQKSVWTKKFEINVFRIEKMCIFVRLRIGMKIK